MAKCQMRVAVTRGEGAVFKVGWNITGTNVLSCQNLSGGAYWGLAATLLGGRYNPWLSHVEIEGQLQIADRPKGGERIHQPNC